MSLGIFSWAMLEPEEDTYDLQKELEAKFDELFGPLENNENQDN